jgi:hypothetical protein
MAIDPSTHLSYSSALNSYLTFCKLHHFDIDPTPETLSLYVTYQSTFINPKSVNSYLLGIANQMEVFFPNVHKNRNSAIVSRTLKSVKKSHGSPIHHKTPLSIRDLKIVHDDLFFLPNFLLAFMSYFVFPSSVFLIILVFMIFLKSPYELPSNGFKMHSPSGYLPIKLILPSREANLLFNKSKILPTPIMPLPTIYAPTISFLHSI